MKKIYTTILIAATTALAGCSDMNLDIPEKGVSEESTYFMTDESCTAATASMYQSLLRKNYSTKSTLWLNDWYFNVLSDDSYKGSSGWKWDDFHYLMMYNFTPGLSYIQNVYSGCFNTVLRCNTIIDNYKDGQTSIMKQSVAEAKVMRSFIYLKLISYWGNPPIVDHVLSSAEEYEQPNATTDALWDFVINSVNEALDSKALISKKNKNDKTTTRITREFALAVKGKAEVFAGRYADAKQSLKEVIKSGKYDLMSGEDLAKNFISSDGDFNCESLFESNLVYSDSINFDQVCPSDQLFAYCGLNASKYNVSSDSWFKTYGANGWQYFNPTEKFINAIIANEGTQSARFKAWFWSYEDLLAMGVKPFESSRTEAEETGSVPTGYKNKCTQPEGCGYWNRKYTGKGHEEWIGGSYKKDEANRRWMRYAEVLLLYAEACAQAGDDGEISGLSALNMIQTRAGAPLSTTLTMEAVKKEKWFEMWNEGCRFVDLIRWGDAKTELADHHSTLPVFMGYKKDADGNVTSDYLIRYIDIAKTEGKSYGFVVGKHEHLPYPDTEIANNRNLKQNYGWE